MRESKSLIIGSKFLTPFAGDFASSLTSAFPSDSYIVSFVQIGFVTAQLGVVVAIVVPPSVLPVLAEIAVLSYFDLGDI